MSGNTVSQPPPRISFDKARLRSDEFKPYIFSMGKLGLDMVAAGYLHAIHPYLRSIEVVSSRVWNAVSDKTRVSERSTEREGAGVEGMSSDILPGKSVVVDNKTETETFLRAEVVVRLTLNDGTVWEGVGDADEFDVEDTGALLRFAETRAIKRSIARALDISKIDLNPERSITPDEEEAYTPLDKSRRQSASATATPQAVKARLPTSIPTPSVVRSSNGESLDW